MARADQPLVRRHRYHGHEFTGPASVQLPRLPWLAGPALVLVLLSAVLWYQVANLGRVYPGVSVFGIDLGGAAPADAGARMSRQITAYSSRPVTLVYGGKEWRVAPSDLGLRFDPSVAVRSAYTVGREGNILERSLARLRAGILGIRLENPGLLFDRPAAEAFAAGLSQQIDRPVVDARLAIREDGKVELSPSQVGRRVDRQVLLQRIAPVLLDRRDGRVEIPVQETAPKIAEAQLLEAESRAVAILREPLALVAADVTRTLSIPELASLVSVQLESSSGPTRALVLLDESKMHSIVEKLAKDIEQGPRGARFERLTTGQLRVLRESQPGRVLDVAAAVELVKQRLADRDRTLILPVTMVEPAVKSEDRTRFSFPELIDENRSDYTGSISERAHNVELATSRLDGVVVMPGQMFSFNEELGPTTLKSGYQIGFGISRTDAGIETVPSVAGGICQVATTLFQPVFFAGYQLEERNWHLYWIPRYAQGPRGLKGLDATVDPPDLDFKFLNTTSNPLLIQARTERQSVIFRLYGTRPGWTVKVEQPKITNVVKADAKVVRQVDPAMPPGKEIWLEHAEDGFDAEIVRTVTSGSDVRTLRLKSTYVPARNVLLTGPVPAVADDRSSPTAEPTPTLNRATGPAQPGTAPTPAATAIPTPQADAARPPATPVPAQPQPSSPKPSAPPAQAAGSAPKAGQPTPVPVPAKPGSASRSN